MEDLEKRKRSTEIAIATAYHNLAIAINDNDDNLPADEVIACWYGLGMACDKALDYTELIALPITPLEIGNIYQELRELLG